MFILKQRLGVAFIPLKDVIEGKSQKWYVIKNAIAQNDHVQNNIGHLEVEITFFKKDEKPAKELVQAKIIGHNLDLVKKLFLTEITAKTSDSNGSQQLEKTNKAQYGILIEEKKLGLEPL